MRGAVIASAMLALLGLNGCKAEIPSGAGAAQPHGRYAGVGIYGPGKGWASLSVSAPSDARSARVTDDEAVIVVIDSQTGEVRACGDLSGYCVGMNPWKASLAGSQVAPVALSEHGESSSSPQAANVGATAAAEKQR